MPDIWLLVFISRGLIGAASDAMTLEQCEARARDLAPDLSHVVCINTHDPSCRIYRDRSTNLAQWQQELEQRCRRRSQPQKESNQ
ncbi:hypothetical protein [Comamonas sp. B-9]|uniref:hypothetical protein n=1 Tax=Comamonas sp. B-9 TaxID=1055192 RepID=UPI0003957F13|nr:hypothetical protein [Comamonas sp. B-9]